MAQKEILIFSVNNRKYGVEVSALQGIETYLPPMGVSNAPGYVSGIVNIRENIYPVVDIRKKFSLPEIPPTAETKYLILYTNAGQVACTVDDVVEIFVAKDEAIQPFPVMLRTEKTAYADCVVRAHDELVVVINAEHLFDDKEAEVLSAVKEAQ